MKRPQAGASAAPFCMICCIDFVFRCQGFRLARFHLSSGDILPKFGDHFLKMLASWKLSNRKLFKIACRMVALNGAKHSLAGKPFSSPTGDPVAPPGLYSGSSVPQGFS